MAEQHPSLQKKHIQRISLKAFGILTLYPIFFIILLFGGLLSCSPPQYATDFDLPPSLTKAIDLFYLENNNEKVLAELQKTIAANSSNESLLLSRILTSAAVCELGKADSAAYLLHQIDTISVKQNPALLFWYNSAKGLILFRQDQLTKAYKILYSSLFASYDQRAIALNKRLLGRICEMSGDYQKAMEWLIESLNLFEQRKLPKSVAVNQKFLGTHFLIMGNFSDALQYYEAAERCFTQYKDSAELFYIYINYADCALQQNNPVKARKYGTMCLKQAEKSNDAQMKTLAYEYMGEVELKEGKPVAAISLFNRALDSSNTIFNKALTRKATIYMGMSQAYRLLRDYTESLVYAKAAIKTVNLCGEFRPAAYNNIAQTYLCLHDNDNALRYLDTARILSNLATSSIAKVDKAFCETRGNLDKMAVKQELMQVGHRKQTFIYSISIGVLLLGIIFMFVVVRLQRKKHLALKELVTKNIEIAEAGYWNKNNVAFNPKQKSDGQVTIEENKYNDLFLNLCNWIETDKNFCRSDLSLEFIAKKLNTNRVYLSRAINDKNIRFNDLINRYRVHEVIRILNDNTNPQVNYTLSGLAKEVGFNSDSVFIEAFKKQTGLTPSQFRKNLPQV